MTAPAVPASGGSPAPDPAAPPRGALGVIFLIVCMDLVGFGIIIPLLPFYVPGYDEHNPLRVTLLFSVYSACQFVAAPILGMLSDRFGRRPVLVVSQLGSAVGYLLLAFAGYYEGTTRLVLVYLSRVIDGFSAGNISTAQAYVSDVTTPENRARGMGVLGAAFGIGFCLGPFLGSMLSRVDITLPGYFAAAFSVLAAFLTWRKLPEVKPKGPAEAEAWLHPRRFLPVLRKPVLAQLLAISFFTMAAFVMMECTVGLFLHKALGFAEWHVGLFFGFLGVVIAVVQGGLVGRLTKAFGEWPLAVAGTLLVAGGMAGFVGTGFIAGAAFAPALAVLLLSGATNATGRSLQQPTVSSLLSRFSDPREQGVVFGMFHGLGSLARVAGPVVAGLTYPLLNNTGQFLTAGVVAVAMALWTAALRARAPAPVQGAAPGFDVIPTAGEPHAVTSEPA